MSDIPVTIVRLGLLSIQNRLNKDASSEKQHRSERYTGTSLYDGVPTLSLLKNDLHDYEETRHKEPPSTRRIMFKRTCCKEKENGKTHSIRQSQMEKDLRASLGLLKAVGPLKKKKGDVSGTIQHNLPMGTVKSIVNIPAI